MGEWTLFSNHGHVLVSLASNNEARLRDVAAAVGITERAVQNILRELQSSGLVQVTKHGRCNRYQINTRKSLRHPLESHVTVGRLLQLLRPDSPQAAETGASMPAEAKAVKPAKGQAGVAAPAGKPAAAKPDPAPAAAPPAAAETRRESKPRADKPAASEKSDGPKQGDKPDNQQGSLF